MRFSFQFSFTRKPSPLHPPRFPSPNPPIPTPLHPIPLNPFKPKKRKTSQMIMPSFVFIIKLQIVVSHFLSENLSSSEWRENSNRSRYKSNPSAEMQIRVSFRQRLPRTPLGTSTLKTSFDSYSKMARQTSAGDTPTRHFEPTTRRKKCETQRRLTYMIATCEHATLFDVAVRHRKIQTYKGARRFMEECFRSLQRSGSFKQRALTTVKTLLWGVAAWKLYSTQQQWNVA